ncbi:MAG: FG-GAP repeat protein, partial [Cyanobacteriota bacterium]|nr:FG-GAP repeat protein [Cyanobacteriota bacterium]
YYWQFAPEFTAPDGSANDNFGLSVALNDGTALISSWLDDDKGENSGSAYLFETITGSLLQNLPHPTVLLTTTSDYQ